VKESKLGLGLEMWLSLLAMIKEKKLPPHFSQTYAFEQSEWLYTIFWLYPELFAPARCHIAFYIKIATKNDG